jgi:hypothetical protein
MARQYEIQLTRDLFGKIIVEARWSRIGCSGQRRRVSFSVLIDARIFIKRLLCQRALSIRKYGVLYRMVSVGNLQ